MKIELRPEVQWFAEHMELALQANDHKGGWRHDSCSALLIRLREETDELKAALQKGYHLRHIVQEAADVANFAMMVADNAASLRGAAFHPTHST